MALPLSELFADHRAMHSVLQMDYFITVRSGGTLFGCYHQALRELSTRYNSLRQSYQKRELLRIKCDEMESKLGGGDQFKKRRRQVKLMAMRLDLAETDRMISELKGEFMRFYSQAISLRQALAEQGVRFPIDAATRDRLDREFWTHRLKAMAAVDLMAHGRIGVATVEFLQALPIDMRKSLATEVMDANGHDELVKWYLNYLPEVPKPIAIDADEILGLLPC